MAYFHNLVVSLLFGCACSSETPILEKTISKVHNQTVASLRDMNVNLHQRLIAAKPDGLRKFSQSGLRKLSSKPSIADMCSYTDEKCEMNVAWAQSKEEALDSNSWVRKLMSEDRACMARKTESACIADAHCEWTFIFSDSMCGLRTYSTHSRQMFGKIVGEGNVCGVRGAILKVLLPVLIRCDALATQAACSANQDCEWDTGPAENSVVGDYCVAEAGSCSPTDSAENKAVCEGQAVDFSRVSANCAGYQDAAQTFDARLDAYADCVKDTCPLVGQQYANSLKGDRWCKGKSQTQCVNPQCEWSNSNSECEGAWMHWQLEESSDSCPLKAHHGKTLMCKGVTGEIACRALANCAWVEDVECADGRVVKITQCSAKTKVLYEEIAVQSCSDEDLVIYQVAAAFEDCGHALGPDACKAVMPAQVAKCPPVELEDASRGTQVAFAVPQLVAAMVVVLLAQ